MTFEVSSSTINTAIRRQSNSSKNDELNKSGGGSGIAPNICAVTNNIVAGGSKDNIRISLDSIESTLNERQISYKEYQQFGCNPEDAKALLEKLESEIPDISQESKQYSVKIRAVLPELKFLASQLSTPETRKNISKQQLDDMKKREEVVREIISTFAMLPDMFRKLTYHQSLSAKTAAKEALIDELVESSLQRLLTGNRIEEDREKLKKQIRHVLSKPQEMSIRLREWFEAFSESGFAKMEKPVKKDLKAGLERLRIAVEMARKFVERDARSFHTGFGRSIMRLSAELDKLRSELKKQMPDQDKIRIPGDNSISSVTDKLEEVSEQSARELSKLLARMNRKKLKLFSVSELVSFNALTPDKKEQCLKLKKMAMPVHDNALRLKKAVIQLEKAISVAGRSYVSKLTGSATPEDAVLTELMVLTGDTPETRLIQAVDAARAVALNILNEPTARQTVNIGTFPHIVQEASDELVPVATLLLEVTRQVAADLRQKSIVSALGSVKKKAQDTISFLNSGLERVTGVACHENYKLLHGMQASCRNYSYGITSLLKKGGGKYPTQTNEFEKNSGEEFLGCEIHLAVLPLLNEAAKIDMARRKLEMTLSAAGMKEHSAYSELEQASRLCSNINLDDIRGYGRAINHLLHDKKVTVLQYNINEPVKLGELLNYLADDLVEAGKALQNASLHTLWEPSGQSHRSELAKIRSKVDDIKASIKDAVEVTTGMRLHNNSSEGMIAKDAAEWLISQKNALSGGCQEEVDDLTEEIIARLSEQYRTQNDPEGKLFRLRIEQAMRDAEKGMIPWPQTAEEHLSGIKTPKQYTLKWAEKRLTYGLLYNLLVHHTPAGMFSLYKKSLGSPLRFLKLLLAPIRMEVTKRAMEKVRPGNSYPADMINKYHKREVFQSVFRLMSMLLPQLPKTLGAAAIVSYGLSEGGEYRAAFMKRAMSRLPQDLLWAGVFTVWAQVVAIGKSRDAGMEDEAEMDKLHELFQALQADIEGEGEYLHPTTILKDANGSSVENTESPIVGKRVKRNVVNGDEHAVNGRGTVSAVSSNTKAVPKSQINNYWISLDEASNKNRYIKQVLDSHPKVRHKWYEWHERLIQKKLSMPQKKINTKEEARERILEVMHDYNYIDTGSKIINLYKINSCIDEKGRNTDGSVNLTYLQEIDDFKFMFNANIMSYIVEDLSGDNFNQYLIRLMKQIINRDDVKEKIGGKTYIKVPRALAMMYSTMLNHIRRYDKDIYFENFKDEDILKFIRIKTAQKNIYNYVLKEFDGKIGEQFKRIDDSEYHSIDLGISSNYKFLNHITQPYLDEKSACYIKIKQDIDKNISDCTTRKIIEIIYDNVISELNAIVSLPLPYSDSHSEAGVYINKLIQVLHNAQYFFGGLYTSDIDGKVDSSLANKLRNEIKTVCNKINNLNGNPNYDCEIDKFMAANKPSGESGNAGVINIGNFNGYEKYKNRLVSQINIVLGKLKDSDLIMKPLVVNDKDSAFISELQRMIGERLEKRMGSNDGVYLLLLRFSCGELKKIEFKLHQNEIVDFFMREVINKSIADNKNSSKFSIMFLSEVTGVDFERVDAVQKHELSSSGNFAKIKDDSLKLYHKMVMTEIYAGQDLFLHQNPKNVPRLVSAIRNKRIGLFDRSQGSSITQAICQEEYNLAIDFIFAELNKGEDIKSFTERLVDRRIKLLEKEVKKLEMQIYTNIDVNTFTTKVRKLKELNLRLLNMRNELKERLETIKYADSIASRCNLVNGKYKSPYLPEEASKSAIINIENVKIAAIRHLYKIEGSQPDELTRLQYLNAYNAFIVSENPNAQHVQNLASLYWAMFYHPEFKDEASILLAYTDSSREPGKLKTFDSILNDESSGRKIKTFSSYAATSKIRYAFNEYHKRIEKERRGDFLRGTYFSITDIHKRSEILGCSMSDFSAQFTEKYTSENMDKDAEIISGGLIRESGIDLRQLDLPPKRIYSYKHLIRDHHFQVTRDRSRELPRNDDVMIVVTPNNSVLISVIYGKHRVVRCMPPAEEEPKLSEILGVVKDLAPYSEDVHYAHNKKTPEFFTKQRKAVIHDIDLFYHMDNTFKYSYWDNEFKTKYFALDCQTIQLSEDDDIYSWGVRDLLVLEKTEADVSGSETVEQVLQGQIKNSLKEKIEVMKAQYNDTEDTLDKVYDYVPLPFFSFASVARKLVNGLPIVDSDIGAMAIDLFSSSDSIFSSISAVKKKMMKDFIRDEIKQLDVAGKSFNKIEKELKSAVSNGLKKFTVSHPLSTFVNGGELVRPTAKQLGVNFNTLEFNTTTKTFSSKDAVSLDSSLSHFEGKFDSEGINISDQVYYSYLKGKMGANQLRQMGMETDKFKPRNMIGQDDIDAMILELDLMGQEALGQYNYSHLAYQQKVLGSQVNMLMGNEDRAQTLARFGVDENAVVDGFGIEGLNHLEQQGGRRFQSAQFIRNGAQSANIIANKGNDIFSYALQPDGMNIYNNLLEDVRSMWPTLGHEQAAQVLMTLMQRNHNVALFTSEMERNAYSNLCFFHQPEGGQNLTMGLMYPSDASRTIFVNVDAGILSPHKTVLHESSHFTGTDDFIYQSSSTGVVVPIRDWLNKWSANADIQQMMQNVSPNEIRTLFGIGPQDIVGHQHYEAAFEIAHSPHFAADVIANNADTYTEFLELVDKKYRLNENNQVIVNPQYRARRDIPSDAEIKQNAAKKMLLRMLYSAANS